MKKKVKKLFVLILVFVMCIVNMMDVGISSNVQVEAETSPDVAEAGTADEENDFEDVSFEHTFEIQSEWENHYNAQMSLKNTAGHKIKNWEVAFMFDGEIENIWNAKIVSHYNNVYVIKNAGWNGDIKPGENVTFGFTVRYEGEKPKEPYDLDMEKVSDIVSEGCKIEFKPFTNYENKVEGQIEITNTSDSYIEDWSLALDADFEIIEIWNANISRQSYGENEEEVQYFLDHATYNQSIEPGQTINVGFIGELLEGAQGIIRNETLYQLTVFPYDEEDELSEDDCIWEGDEDEDDPMSVIDDEVFDEDDYDRMDEDELAAENVGSDGSVQVTASTKSSISKKSVSRSTATGKKDGDQISYYIYGLPHKRQVQTWCQYIDNKANVDVIFVAQNDEKGNSVISLCKKESEGSYKYDSEIQIRKTGHTQSLHCQGKKGGKYYIFTNCHGVTFADKNGKTTVWGTRFGRVTFDTGKNGINKSGKKAKNIVDMDTDKSKMQLEHTVKGDNLKYFKAVAYAREQTKSFAGESKRKD